MAKQWIRVAKNGMELNVTKRAADHLGMPRAHILGHFVALWSWLSDRSDTGSIAEYADGELERAAGWVGKAGAFATFVRQHHTDSKDRIKDWDEFMGPLVKARAMARERQRSHRAKIREQQDADADAASGKGGPSSPQTSVDNRVDNSVTRDTTGKYSVRTRSRQLTPVTRDTPDVTRDSLNITRDGLTEVELRKSIRTTGMYLSTELELVGSEGLDEKAISSSNSNYRDPSQLQGIKLVRKFASTFYRGDGPAMLHALQRLRAVQRPAGVMVGDARVTASPALVVRAMNEVLSSPPRESKAAVAIVLKKLSGGHLHEVTTPDGTLVTEALAAKTRELDKQSTAALAAILPPDLLASIGRSMPTKNMPVPRGASLLGLATGDNSHTS